MDEARSVILSSLASSMRNARSHPRTTPEPSEAVGEAQHVLGVPLTSSRRDAWSHHGTTPEQVEAVGEREV